MARLLAPGSRPIVTLCCLCNTLTRNLACATHMLSTPWANPSCPDQPTFPCDAHSLLCTCNAHAHGSPLTPQAAPSCPARPIILYHAHSFHCSSNVYAHGSHLIPQIQLWL
mmetsp:Transcript_81800/g.162849  ORF Transcript_81800/g.162849 Transcript_81800/m.162849 type:complete len:111 (+) Transcript_81800:192-524(+)